MPDTQSRGIAAVLALWLVGCATAAQTEGGSDAEGPPLRIAHAIHEAHEEFPGVELSELSVTPGDVAGTTAGLRSVTGLPSSRKPPGFHAKWRCWLPRSTWWLPAPC